jgi:hypothetical protein
MVFLLLTLSLCRFIAELYCLFCIHICTIFSLYCIEPYLKIDLLEILLLGRKFHLDLPDITELQSGLLLQLLVRGPLVSLRILCNCGCIN